MASSRSVNRRGSRTSTRGRNPQRSGPSRHPLRRNRPPRGQAPAPITSSSLAGHRAFSVCRGSLPSDYNPADPSMWVFKEDLQVLKEERDASREEAERCRRQLEYYQRETQVARAAFTELRTETNERLEHMRQDRLRELLMIRTQVRAADDLIGNMVGNLEEAAANPVQQPAPQPVPEPAYEPLPVIVIDDDSEEDPEEEPQPEPASSGGSNDVA